MTKVLCGNFPILATAWAGDSRFEPKTQARLIDWLIASGVNGLVVAANGSEGHAQSDVEPDQIVRFALKRVASRVPVIVTVKHFALELARARGRARWRSTSWTSGPCSQGSRKSSPAQHRLDVLVNSAGIAQSNTRKINETPTDG